MRKYFWMVTIVACLIAPVIGSAQSFGTSKKGSSLPIITCDRFDCAEDYTARRDGAQFSAPEAPNSSVALAGPPPGQRLHWLAAGYPSCQSLGAGPVTYPDDFPYDPAVGGTSRLDPYVYILATNVQVPLGSTFASLSAPIETNLSASPAGAMATFARLQIKRSSESDGAWENVDAAYSYSIYGIPLPTSLYGRATYQGLVSLARLGPSAKVGIMPEQIDIRLIAYNVFSGDEAVTDIAWNQVCRGMLDLMF